MPVLGVCFLLIRLFCFVIFVLVLPVTRLFHCVYLILFVDLAFGYFVGDL